MVKTILLVISGGFLAWTASASAVIFWYILRDGGITLVEPRRPVLLTEFISVIILACFGGFSVVYAIIKKREG